MIIQISLNNGVPVYVETKYNTGDFINGLKVVTVFSKYGVIGYELSDGSKIFEV